MIDAVILVSAAVLLALSDRVLILPGLLGTTYWAEVGESSSSEEVSSRFAFLLERVGLVEHGAGVCSTGTWASKLKSSC